MRSATTSLSIHDGRPPRRFPSQGNGRSRRWLDAAIPCAAVVLTLLTAKVGWGGDEPGDAVEATEAEEIAPFPTTSFAPEPPPAETYDWIQIKSEEWLKGKVKRLRRESMEFDSHEFDILTFDWKDIKQLRSPGNHTYRFDGKIFLTGPAVVTPDKVTIATEEGVRELPRHKLNAIVPEATRERDRWTGRASLGMTARSGNTNQVDVNTALWIRRETAQSRVRVDYSGAYGTVEGVENSNTHRATGKWDIYLTRSFYVSPLSTEFFRDPMSNISSRSTPSVGVGYDIFNGRVEWSVEGGLAYQRTQFESVQVGEDQIQNAGALLFGTNIEADLTHRVDLDVSYSVQVSFPQVGDTNHSLQALLSVDITTLIDLDVTAIMDRIEDPRPTSTGEIPESNDFRLIVGLAVEY